MGHWVVLSWFTALKVGQDALQLPRISVNLAISLHNKETPVAVVDTNLQFGDVAVFLNETVRYSVLDISSRADELDNELIDEVLINHAASGIRVLAAPPRPIEER